jgi:hypothetical protein
MTTGFSNLFANIGGLSSAYGLGVVKDKAGSFSWGFVGIGVLCLIGVALSIVLARMRKTALAAQAVPPAVVAGKPLAASSRGPT